jgi:hypothetical protein
LPRETMPVRETMRSISSPSISSTADRSYRTQTGRSAHRSPD